jgi:hypothetical protein
MIFYIHNLLTQPIIVEDDSVRRETFLLTFSYFFEAENFSPPKKTTNEVLLLMKLFITFTHQYLIIVEDCQLTQ